MALPLFHVRTYEPVKWGNLAHYNHVKFRAWAIRALYTVRSNGREGVYEYY